MLKSTFSGFFLQQYGSIFIRLAVVASQISERLNKLGLMFFIQRFKRFIIFTTFLWF